MNQPTHDPRRKPAPAAQRHARITWRKRPGSARYWSLPGGASASVHVVGGYSGGDFQRFLLLRVFAADASVQRWAVKRLRLTCPRFAPQFCLSQCTLDMLLDLTPEPGLWHRRSGSGPW